jgi:hypothetical protein
MCEEDIAARIPRSSARDCYLSFGTTSSDCVRRSSHLLSLPDTSRCSRSIQILAPFVAMFIRRSECHAHPLHTFSVTLSDSSATRSTVTMPRRPGPDRRTDHQCACLVPKTSWHMTLSYDNRNTGRLMPTRRTCRTPRLDSITVLGQWHTLRKTVQAMCYRYERHLFCLPT